MSQADELLNSLNEGIAVASVDPETEPHIVIDNDRNITVPDELRRIAVQYDHNIETVTFDCPRYWDGHDLSEMTIYINYMRSDGGKGFFIAENVTVDENDNDIMHFTWTITKNVTMYKGSVSFLVCITTVDADGDEEVHWNSELCNQISVSEGLECREAVEEAYPDIYTQLVDMVNSAANIDAELSTSSTNPVQNKAVSLHIVAHDAQLTQLQEKVQTNINDISELQNIVQPATEIKLIEETTDWDTLTATGFYIVLYNATGNGMPETPDIWSKSGTLTVRAHDNGVIMQEYCQSYTNNVYRRVKSSTTWNPWYSDEVTLSLLPSGTDLNSLRNGSRYLLATYDENNNPTTYINLPPTLGGSRVGLVETYEWRSTSVSGVYYQHYTDFNMGDTFTRIATRVNSTVTWRAWKCNKQCKFNILPDGSDLDTLSECTYVGDNSMTYTNFPPVTDQVGVIDTYNVVGSVLKYQRFTQWRTGDIYYRLNMQAGWTEWSKKEDTSKKEISILFVGNSLTQDGISYLPYVLKNYFPEVSFKLYMWYNGGKTLAGHYEYFTNDTACEIFSVAENKASWTNSSKTMSSILSTYKFDIVCMQEYLNYKSSFTEENLVDWNNCADYIVNNYTGGNALKFVQLFHAPKRDGIESIYEVTKTANNLILKNTVSEDMIGTGIAVYKALSTELDSLGDAGHLSPDGTHTQEGLPCLIQTYVATLWVLDKLGIPKSIYDCPLRMTTGIYNSINVPGANLGSGVITGTDEQNILAQEIAIQAYKESKQFVMGANNADPSEVDLSDYYNKSEVDAKISTVNDDISALEEAIDNIESQGVDLSDYYNKTEVDSKITTLTNRADANDTVVGNLSNALNNAVFESDIDTELSTSSTNPVQNKAVAARVEALDSQVTQLQGKVQTNINDISSHYGLIQKNTTDIGTHENRIVVLNNNVSSLQTGLSNTVNRVSTNENNISDLQTDISFHETTLGYHNRNLIRNTATTATINKVTFTTNSDGSVTALSTVAPPGNAWFEIATNVPLEAGSYILSGDDSIKSGGYGEIRIYVNGTIYRTGTTITFDSPVTITKAGVFIFVNKNLNGSKIVYPMLRHSYDTDTTYEPGLGDINTRLNELLTRIKALEAK